ncbi:MAG TPA: D-glucuronyl C5-epimerase family protein [Solirubrobacteraceae bacterium]
MLGRLFGLSLVAMALALPASASAAPVLVMGAGGHVHRANDRYLPALAVTPAPAASVARAPRAVRPKKPQKTVTRELARLYHSHQITAAAYRGYTASYAAALAAEKRLTGTRRAELTAVTVNVHNLAARGFFNSSRLPVIFMTVDRNRQWWTTGTLLSSGERVEFTGSQLVWEYYRGQGIELQVLGTFGKADGLYTAGAAQYGAMRSLVGEMLPLAVRRSGNLVWEYYFNFDGGRPPWVSAMSQGTAIEALTRAYLSLAPTGQPTGGVSLASTTGPNYLRVAHQALSIFAVAPPVGVRIGTSLGARYLQYSFAPGVDIINAFLQSLIGLYDYSQASGDQQAAALFAAGDRQAQAELPMFDTGSWSLYQPGVLDTVDYHKLVTGFLQELCDRTQASVYCREAARFQSYLSRPPSSVS